MSAYAEYVILPLLKEQQRRMGKPVQSGLLAQLVGKSRRRTYDYLRELAAHGRVMLVGRRWQAQHHDCV